MPVEESPKVFEDLDLLDNMPCTKLFRLKDDLLVVGGHKLGLFQVDLDAHVIKGLRNRHESLL